MIPKYLGNGYKCGRNENFITKMIYLHEKILNHIGLFSTLNSCFVASFNSGRMLTTPVFVSIKIFSGFVGF